MFDKPTEPLGFVCAHRYGMQHACTHIIQACASNTLTSVPSCQVCTFACDQSVPYVYGFCERLSVVDDLYDSCELATEHLQADADAHVYHLACMLDMAGAVPSLQTMQILHEASS